MANKYYRVIQRILSIQWIKTIGFNTKYLPLHIAIRLPILLYKSRTDFSGKIHLDFDKSNVRFGMIKLGVNHENCLYRKGGFSLQGNGTIVFKGSLILGNASSITIMNEGILTFGANCGLTGGVMIHCGERIDIEDNFSCSWNTTISDSDLHEYIDADTQQPIPCTKPIRIGSNVWCCQNVILSKGAVIPDWCTIASGSVVNKNFSNAPAGSIIAGIPASVIDKRIRRKDLTKISSLKHWNITNGFRLFNPQQEMK